MAAVQGILVDDPASRPVDGILLNDPEKQPLHPFPHGNADDEGDGECDSCFCLCICMCCCLILVLPLVINIAIAVGSAGYTSCPEVAPFIGQNTSDIPAIHSVVTKAWDWNFWYEHSSVYDPLVSNTTRIGYWRTAKTWYLRDVWAYVPEGSDKPGVVAFQPFLSWTTTFDIERCFPKTRHIVSQDYLWFWQWGEHNQQWTVKNGQDQVVANAKKSKEWLWSPFGVPNGWQTVVWSALQPNLAIGQLSQSFSTWFASDSVWSVYVTKPELLEPHVLSFMAAGNDLADHQRRSGHHGNNRYHRRMEGVSEDEDAEEAEGKEQEVV
jgi:hypothetical protein